VEPDRDNRQGRSDELSRSRPAYEGVLGYIQRRIREIVTERAKDG
jgi:hypothetical protein